VRPIGWVIEDIEKFTSIEKENIVLFGKINNIMNKPRVLATVASRSSHERSGGSIENHQRSQN
jgi:hypothetical protein